MPAHRIYDPDLPTDLVVDSQYAITGDEARHGVSVKRLHVGEEVAILNGSGAIAQGEIAQISKKPARMVISIISVQSFTPPFCSICIASAVPKGQRADHMVDQLGQVGISIWQPMLTHRSIVNPRSGKIEKWRRFAVESMKQSGRPYIMKIGQPASIMEILHQSSLLPRCITLLADQGGEILHEDMVVLPNQPVEEESVQAKIDSRDNSPINITILIGPEGGFTPEEIQTACNPPYGARVVSLCPHTMRVETAAVVAAGLVINRL